MGKGAFLYGLDTACCAAGDLWRRFLGNGAAGPLCGTVRPPDAAGDKAQRPRQLELEQLGEDALLDAVRSYCEQHEDARLTLWDGAPWDDAG